MSDIGGTQCTQARPTRTAAFYSFFTARTTREVTDFPHDAGTLRGMEAALQSPATAPAGRRARDRARASSWRSSNGERLHLTVRELELLTALWSGAIGSSRARSSTARSGASPTASPTARSTCTSGKLRQKLERGRARKALHPHPFRVRLPLRRRTRSASRASFTSFLQAGDRLDNRLAPPPSRVRAAHERPQGENRMRKLLTLAACGVAGPWSSRLWQRRQQRQRQQRRGRRRRRPLRHHHDRRLQHRGPVRPGRPGGVPGREPGREDHGRHLGHRRRLREVLRRRDRHLGRLAADQARRGGPALQEERDQVPRGPGRQRRHRRRDQQEPEGRLPDRRPAQEAVEQGLEGQEPQRDRPEAPGHASSSCSGPDTDSGRSTSSPTRSTARRASRATTTSPRQTTT